MDAEAKMDQTALSAALTPPTALPPEEPMEYEFPGASDSEEGL